MFSSLVIRTCLNLGFVRDNHYSNSVIQLYQAIVKYVITISFVYANISQVQYLKEFRRLTEHAYVMFSFKGKRESTVRESAV